MKHEDAMTVLAQGEAAPLGLIRPAMDAAYARVRELEGQVQSADTALEAARSAVVKAITEDDGLDGAEGKQVMALIDGVKRNGKSIGVPPRAALQWIQVGRAEVYMDLAREKCEGCAKRWPLVTEKKSDGPSQIRHSESGTDGQRIHSCTAQELVKRSKFEEGKTV